MSARIQQAFARIRQRGEVGIIPYLTIGFPRPGATQDLVPALVEGGAGLIELGVPFSDPLADGPTIQRASFQALKNGVTVAFCLAAVGQLRERGVTVPLVFMGYYNPFLYYGLERFAADAASAGVDGLIVPDLPTEEAGPLREACGKRGIDIIGLLAPTSTEERIAAACRVATGFVYCVSLTGVTGAREELPPGIPDLVGRVRRHTSLPVAVGFGVSRREHVEAVGRSADAAVVGSALINALEAVPPEQAAREARDFLMRLSGRTHLVVQRAAP